jgi:hypothetical protein
MSYDDKNRREFPFEDTIRTRYSSFRGRQRHGFSSILDLLTLIVFLSIGLAVLAAVWFALVFVLFISPFFIIGIMALRWISPQRPEPYRPTRRDERDPDVTIIDVEVDRS